MPQTPALDVAIHPLRPAMVALYGTARGDSWVEVCLTRSIGAQTAAGTRPRGGPCHGDGDRRRARWPEPFQRRSAALPDITGAAAPPPVPPMPPEEITVGRDATLAEWEAPYGSCSRQFVAFPAAALFANEYACLIVTIAVRELERGMFFVQQACERAHHEPNRRAEVLLSAPMERSPHAVRRRSKEIRRGEG